MRTNKEYLQYLRELQDKAYHNKLCYSANYAMTAPRPGCEELFQIASEEAELVEELIAMVSQRSGAKELPARDPRRRESQSACNSCIYQKDIEKMRKILVDLDNFFQTPGVLSIQGGTTHEN